jgi:hypothetical protein
MMIDSHGTARITDFGLALSTGVTSPGACRSTEPPEVLEARTAEITNALWSFRTALGGQPAFSSFDD